MALFEFKIWTRKTLDVVDDEGDLVQVQHPTDTDWVKRTFDIETDQIRITCFQEHEIFADEVKSKSCVQVFLSDDDYVYAAYSMDSWKKIYNEKYLPLVPPTLADIVEDLKGEAG